MEGENQEQKMRRKKLNLYRLPPKCFEGREDVITFNNLSKKYKLSGREEDVLALRSVSLNSTCEFYAVKKYKNPLFSYRT
jgi:hypothetical protein